MLPLYQSLPSISPLAWAELTRSQTAHPGLLYDKFPAGWGSGWQVPDGAKSQFFEAATRYQTYSLKEGINNHIARQKKLLQTLSGEVLELQTSTPLIIGQGIAHPYESGFQWHHTLGVPYLPGSAIKGLLREWLSRWEQLNPSRLIELLGGDEFAEPEEQERQHEPVKEHQNQQARVGALQIFDAIPLEPPKLEVDILNPHYQPYYSGKAEYPADYFNPVPVNFLTVAPGTAFLFGLAATPGKTVDVRSCANYLSEALATLGIGAKTAVGYGLMSEDGCQAQARRDGHGEKVVETLPQSQEREKKSNEEREKAAERDLTPEQQLNRAIDSVTIDKLPELLGPSRNQTRNQIGQEYWENYLNAIKEKFGPEVAKWRTSSKGKEKKAYRTLFGLWKPDSERDQ